MNARFHKCYDEYGNLKNNALNIAFNMGLTSGKKQARAEAIDELKPFFDVCEELVFDWICDDLCGEFINPDTDEYWCAEHCHNCTGYECIKKWCELKRIKEQSNE